VPVERLSVQQLVGTDHAGVADVDHVRVGDVQPDTEADQEDHSDRKPRDRDEQPQRLARTSASERQQQHPCEQVEQERIHERYREPDLSVVEQRQRDREPQQHQQIEVQQRWTPASPGNERRDEQQAHRDPDVPRVDPAPERPRVAAGHRPGHLKAGPRLRHLAGRVVDVYLDQLDLMATRGEPAHLPGAGSLRVLVRKHPAMAAKLGSDGRVRGRDPLDPGGGQPVAGGRRVLGRDEHRCVAIGDSCRHGPRPRTGGGTQRTGAGRLGAARSAQHQKCGGSGRGQGERPEPAS
jgi:hypothetical protein